MPQSSTQNSSIDHHPETQPHQLLKEQAKNHSIKIDKLRTIINKHNVQSVAAARAGGPTTVLRRPSTDGGLGKPGDQPTYVGVQLVGSPSDTQLQN